MCNLFVMIINIYIPTLSSVITESSLLSHDFAAQWTGPVSHEAPETCLIRSNLSEDEDCWDKTENFCHCFLRFKWTLCSWTPDRNWIYILGIDAISFSKLVVRDDKQVTLFNIFCDLKSDITLNGVKELLLKQYEMGCWYLFWRVGFKYFKECIFELKLNMLTTRSRKSQISNN